MGLKNLDVFKNRSARPISFSGIRGAHRVVDEQIGGECWIEALENLAQLYLPTKYSTIASAREAVKISVQNPDAIESTIRYALVKDFIENNGRTFGYYIEFCQGKQTIKVITASNATPQERQTIAQYANNARACYQEVNPNLIVDDNVGIYPSKIDLGRPLTKAEAEALPGATAYYRIISNILGIEVSHYQFSEEKIREGLSQDRPVFFRADVSGFEYYKGQSGGHAVLIVDYMPRENTYCIMDSNKPEVYKKVTQAELCNAAKAHYSYGTRFQLFIPDKGTTWNRVMGM